MRCAEGPPGPEGYVNKYRNGWAAAANHIRTTVEELKRAKGKKGTYIPTGVCHWHMRRVKWCGKRQWGKPILEACKHVQAGFKAYLIL